MKKLFLTCILIVCAIAANAWTAEIETSCGWIIEMEYESHHGIGDAIEDALILEQIFC